MEELRIIGYIASIFKDNPSLTVAMFGWIVTLVAWQRSEAYHRGQYDKISDRHDAERRLFVDAIQDMKQTMVSMRDLMVRMEART